MLLSGVRFWNDCGALNAERGCLGRWFFKIFWHKVTHLYERLVGDLANQFGWDGRATRAQNERFFQA